MNIIWIDIKDYEGLYKVSNCGDVRSEFRTITDKNGRLVRVGGFLLKQAVNGAGYKTVSLSKYNKKKNYSIHSLVGQAFLEYVIKGRDIVIDHIDNNKLNNNVFNLRVISQGENISKGKKLNGTTSKYNGVSFHKGTGKWRAEIGRKYIGLFETEELAYEAFKNSKL